MKTLLGIACATVLAAVVTAAPRPQTKQVKVSETSASGGGSLLKAYGSRNAPITMEVFSDYQCPHCDQFYLGPAKQLMHDYVDTGKVYLVHHDYVLPQFPHSHEAAEFANAAAVAGLWPEVDDALWNTQSIWAPTGKIEETLATKISAADMKKIQAAEAAQKGRIDNSIESDKQLGNSKGVDQTGTPSIFIVHKGLSTEMPEGVPNYSLLKAYLDSLLQH